MGSRPADLQESSGTPRVCPIYLTRGDPALRGGADDDNVVSRLEADIANPSQFTPPCGLYDCVMAIDDRDPAFVRHQRKRRPMRGPGSHPFRGIRTRTKATRAGN